MKRNAKEFCLEKRDHWLALAEIADFMGQQESAAYRLTQAQALEKLANMFGPEETINVMIVPV